MHKTNLSLRPMSGLNDSAYPATARFATPILELVHRKSRVHRVKDSFTFIKRIKDHNLTVKIVLSMDVKSLVPTVPLVETMGFICQCLTENDINVGIPPTKLKELIPRCMWSIRFL